MIDQLMVPKDGLEPSRLSARDFESLVSTDFTTWALTTARMRIIPEGVIPSNFFASLLHPISPFLGFSCGLKGLDKLSS